MTEGLSPADIAAVQGGGFGGFGNEGLWLFAILALMGGGFGNWGNRGTGDRNATVGDVQRATDFAALERQNNETVAAAGITNLDITAIVRNACGCESSLLSLILGGVESVVNNLAVTVEKL